MAEKDVVITYETLFELLRIEKNREDLQKLSESFFDDVRAYLNDKKYSFDSQESQSLLFAADDKEKARLEIENIKKILKQLYDLREKKIINTSVNKARTGVTLINTANMLPSERLLFDSISMVLTEFRKNILFRLACGEVPNVDSLPDSVVSKLNCDLTSSAAQEPIPASSSDEDEEGTGGMHFRAAEEPKELKTTPNFSDLRADIKKVRFLAAIGEIVGPDLKIYGPYDEGTVITLPNELARVLVEKKQAEEVTN
ncbi:DNA replication complex GINS family protein [Candidatus Woesearchaeota archaeon]|nr:DNA replication complex GINS family protein [Candidatus Woesearchaeota archaeon]